MRPILDFDFHRIDAKRRLYMIFKHEVGCRKANGAAALVAGDDMRLDRPAMTKQFGRPLRIASHQPLANAGR